MGGTHWNGFHRKDNKTFYFETFGVQTGNFSLEQLTKPITYHFIKYKT